MLCNTITPQTTALKIAIKITLKLNQHLSDAATTENYMCHKCGIYYWSIALDCIAFKKAAWYQWCGGIFKNVEALLPDHCKLLLYLEKTDTGSQCFNNIYTATGKNSNVLLSHQINMLGVYQHPSILTVVKQ